MFVKKIFFLLLVFGLVAGFVFAASTIILEDGIYIADTDGQPTYQITSGAPSGRSDQKNVKWRNPNGSVADEGIVTFYVPSGSSPTGSISWKKTPLKLWRIISTTSFKDDRGRTYTLR